MNVHHSFIPSFPPHLHSHIPSLRHISELLATWQMTCMKPTIQILFSVLSPFSSFHSIASFSLFSSSLLFPKYPSISNITNGWNDSALFCFVVFFHLPSLWLSFLRASQLILLVSSKHSHPITWRAHPGNGFKEGLLYSPRTVTSTGPPFPWVIECDVIIRPVTWTFWPGDPREEPMLLFLSEELGTRNLRYFITCVHVQPDGQRGHLWVESNVKSGPWAKFS